MTFREDVLSGQHIVISGGAGALGIAIVKKLTSHGAKMTVNDIVSVADAHVRFQEADIDINCLHYIQADLTHKPNVEQLINSGRATFGAVHTVLCHVGMVQTVRLLDVQPDDWDKTMAVNVKSAMLLGQVGAKSMLADNIKGQLIFTTSWVAETPWPEIGPYNTSKAAMNQLMRSFARELADKGLRANAIAPGIVGAGMAKHQWDTDPSYKARASKAIPLGALQSLESVADAFLFMCSSAAIYMTGSVLTVDGGCSLYPMD